MKVAKKIKLIQTQVQLVKQIIQTVNQKLQYRNRGRGGGGGDEDVKLKLNE